MIEMFRSGPDFLLHLYREYGPVHYMFSPVLPAVLALGPDATQAVFSNRNKDFSQRRVGSGDRAVLQGRAHAARLRRPHVPPPNHAGGLHPQPSHRATSSTSITWPPAR